MKLLEKIAVTGITAALVIPLAACGSSSPSSQCKELVSDTYARDDTKYTEITFTDGDFIKGVIGQYVGGEDRRIAHWECDANGGEPEITFYSPAD